MQTAKLRIAGLIGAGIEIIAANGLVYAAGIVTEIICAGIRIITTDRSVTATSRVVAGIIGAWVEIIAANRLMYAGACSIAQVICTYVCIITINRIVQA